MKKCKNWSFIENELGKIKDKKETSISKIIAPSMVSVSLTGSVLFYAIYKKRNINFKTNINGDVELAYPLWMVS